jgi:glycosyltransferase involved in cell wall biosynthesis
MLEAMASGLPIVASRLPAHDDLLREGGGILCGTAGEALAALEAMSDSRENRLLGQCGRTRMRDELGTWDDCAQRYIALYRELLGGPDT